MKAYSIFPKVPGLEPQNQMQFSVIRGTRVERATPQHVSRQWIVQPLTKRKRKKEKGMKERKKERKKGGMKEV